MMDLKDIVAALAKGEKITPEQLAWLEHSIVSGFDRDVILVMDLVNRGILTIDELALGGREYREIVTRHGIGHHSGASMIRVRSATMYNLGYRGTFSNYWLAKDGE